MILVTYAASARRVPLPLTPIATSLLLALPALAGAGNSPPADSAAPTLDEIAVTAQRLNEARAGIQTQTGASTYTIDADAVAATPGGDNTLLNQVIMQAPEVAQDSFGQFHVRGEHNGLQYRLNGIILPEGISVFGQSLDPRLISSMSLITGALPAEYGLRTAGIIDLTTKSGLLQPGGAVSIYGGSHGTIQPSINYGGGSGPFSYFASADMLRSDLGIESPDGSSDPLHDHTRQYHGFGSFEYIAGPSDRVGLMLGSSVGRFQIPDRTGEPSLGLTVDGRSDYPGARLDENQQEITHFAAMSWQHSDGPLNVQTALIARYSSLSFEPDPLGDLLFTGIAQDALKQNTAYALQSDASYRLGDRHTLRGGLYLQSDHSVSRTVASVLRVDANGAPVTDIPIAIEDDGTRTEWIGSLYLQDEWQLLPSFTLNYGLRVDRLSAFTSGGQVSPRVNAVWQPVKGTTLHAGYARYFSPPPFELVGSRSIAKFTGTTAAPGSSADSPPLPERADYLDVGAQQKIGSSLSLGLDSYYKVSRNLIDEGQFGAPIILTPFNYLRGRQYGVEFSANYTHGDFTGYLNLAGQSARGQQIDSSEFNFAPPDLAWIANHPIHLDHEQAFTASGGLSWLWQQDTRLSADLVIGSGLRADLDLPPGQTTPYGGAGIPNGDHLPYYMQVNLGSTHEFHLGGAGSLTARLDVINLFDRVYEIRNGTGIGVGAPQFGPRRGLFFGLSKAL